MALIDEWNAAAPLGPDGLPSGPPSFVRRVAMAMLAAASDVTWEDASHANHSNRSALAKLVVTDPLRWMGPFAMLLASEGESDASDDATITARALALWDVMAGL